MFGVSNKSVAATTRELSFIYEMLFCDELSFYAETLDDITQYPWSVLFNPAATAADLYELIDQADNSRIKLLSYNKLMQGHYPILKQEVLAVVVEVGLQNGADALACYRDGTARYINHTGKIVFWESATEQSTGLTDRLFQESEKMIVQLGPWQHGRLNPPKSGHARITLMVSNGLYFGEAPSDTLFNDELAAPALQAATAFLGYISTKVL